MTNQSTEETTVDRNNPKVLLKQLKFSQLFIYLEQTIKLSLSWLANSEELIAQATLYTE